MSRYDAIFRSIINYSLIQGKGLYSYIIGQSISGVGFVCAWSGKSHRDRGSRFWQLSIFSHRHRSES